MRGIVIDFESDGLYGCIIAGAFVYIEDGIISHKEWYRIKDLNSIKNQWVKENVIPKLEMDDFCVAVDTEKELIEKMFQKVLQYNCPVWGHCIHPVETGALKKWVEYDIKNRIWESPYPIHEIGTLLYAIGFDPRSVENFMNINGTNFTHNPLYDCVIEARALLRLIDIVSNGKSRLD